MEAGKPSSCSSFTSDLFDQAKDSSSSSKILSTIFPPPPNKKVRGMESTGMSENEKKTAQTPALGDNWVSKDRSRYFQEEETPPFHYSSSIYYGGQDVYTTQPKTKTFKEVGEDDSNSGSASRGNWWQGSLYY